MAKTVRRLHVATNTVVNVTEDKAKRMGRELKAVPKQAKSEPGPDEKPEGDPSE